MSDEPTTSEPAPSDEPAATDEQASSEELDAMTKAELLDYAKWLGVSPANNDMTKDELRAGVDEKQGTGSPPEAEQQITTTSTKDFLGVPLVNATPGTSQATDRLGRSVIAGNKDYLARNLVP